MNPILRKRTVLVLAIGAEERALVDELYRTMTRHRGVGLAAPQVGVAKRIAVVAVGDKAFTLINPWIIERSGTQRVIEGCLSLPGIAAGVRRPSRIRFTATDERGIPYTADAEGLLAQAVQHEVDHLDGVLFIDHIGWWKRRQLLKQYNARRHT